MGGHEIGPRLSRTKNITDGDYYRFRHGALFIPAPAEKTSKSCLLFGSDSQPYPCSVPLEDLNKIEHKYRSFFYAPINETTEAKKTFSGGLKVRNTNLATFRTRIHSAFSTEEFGEIRKAFTLGI